MIKFSEFIYKILFYIFIFFCLIMTNSQANDCIIIANAEKFNFKEIKKDKKYKYIVLDGASNQAYKDKFIPDVVLGDFDSINNDIMNKLKKLNANIVNAYDQNYTDLQKGIIYCEKNYQPAKIFILNSLGGARLDHEITNIFIGRYFVKKDYEIITIHSKNHQCVKYLKNDTIIFDGQKDDNVGIFGINNAIGNSDGLLYELKNYELSLGISDSSSNSMSKNIARISIKGEGIVIYPCNSIINEILK
jgi:thiamine pyrophosphokinase